MLVGAYSEVRGGGWTIQCIKGSGNKVQNAFTSIPPKKIKVLKNLKI